MDTVNKTYHLSNTEIQQAIADYITKREHIHDGVREATADMMFSQDRPNEISVDVIIHYEELVR